METRTRILNDANRAIYSRSVPLNVHVPHFSFMPVNTRTTVMATQVKEPNSSKIMATTSHIAYANSQARFVNVESMLRNQVRGKLKY